VRTWEKVLPQDTILEGYSNKFYSVREMENFVVSKQDKTKIFVSGSIRGGRQLLDTYRFICETLRENGAEVLSWHIADPELEETESKMTEQEIYDRDMGLLAKSDALIAEVTVPSTGVGYEICRALDLKIPVLCLHRPDTAVSAMVLGNPYPSMKIRDYSNKDALQEIIIEFIRAL
jgi:hypothetical protein